MRRFGGLIALVFFLAACAISAEGQKPTTFPAKSSILIINSYHQGFVWTDTLVAAVVRKISEQSPQTTFYVEYMDTKRFPNNGHPSVVLRYFQSKYSGFKPDAIIVSDDAALSFTKTFRDQLFPRVPVLYCGINELSQTENLPTDFGGILESLDIPDNLQLIGRILPQVRTIAVVTDGTPTGLGTRREIQHAAKSFPAYRFLYLNGEELNTEELQDKLASLSADSAVIAPAWYLDRTGRVLTNDESYPLIAKASPVPVIVTSAANLGLGVLGGKVNSGETQGEYAANLALKVLNQSILPSDFTPQTQSRNDYVFDAQQLARFGIGLQLLPSGSRIINRPFSFYQTYKELVWGVSITFLLFAALIILLIVIVMRLRLAQRKLSASEENLRITLQSIGDGVIRTDRCGFITGMNPVAERLTGCHQGACLGRPLSETCRLVTIADRKPRECPAYEALRTGNIVSLKRDVILIPNDGKECCIATSCAPIRSNSGEIAGAVLIFRDITEELLVEEQLRHSQKMDAIGQLAGGIAHDFNNMLGGILGGAEMAQLTLPKESESRCYLSLIVNAAEHAAALTEKLLAFSRKGKIFSTPIIVHECIEDGLTILARTINKNITICRDFKAADTVIVGDPSQIQNAIINLGVNAAHAMPEGGRMTVSTCNVHLKEDDFRNSGFSIHSGEYLKVRVQDTGCGIDPLILPRIFEPFFTTKQVGKGTGLGLSAVYGMIKDHHGCITVESTISKGTTFTLYFPLAHEKIALPPRLEETLPAASGTILVIDDEEVIRLTAQSMLEHHGYQVFTANDGLEGIALYSERWQEIDLVIMDMVMPKLGGLDCFLRMQEVNPKIRCLISSGFAREAGIKELLQRGVTGFIKKPYRKDDLLKAVANVLSAKYDVH